MSLDRFAKVRMNHPSPHLGLVLLTLILADHPMPASAQDRVLKSGYQPVAYAIENARIYARMGVTYAPGTIVVREGRIEAIGPSDEVPVPPDAECIEGKGLFVSPGWLDMDTYLGSAPGVERSATGNGPSAAFRESAEFATPEGRRPGITPEFEVARFLDIADSVIEKRRSLGFTAILAAPGGSIVGGQSALMSLGGRPRRESVMLSPVGFHIRLQPPTVPGEPRTAGDPSTVEFRRLSGYPISRMGVIAHLRQAMFDADHHRRLKEFAERTGAFRPPFDPDLEALAEASSGQMPTFWEADSRDEIHGVLDLAEEFGTKCVIVGGREASRVVDRLKALDVPVILRLDFPEEPKVPSKDEYAEKPAEDRLEPLRLLDDTARRWRERVETASVLHREGVRFAFAGQGLDKIEDFHKQLRIVVERGLPVDAALDALTRRAAEIAGIGDDLGTLEVGKLGHVVAWTDSVEAKEAKPRFVLVDGLKFEVNRPDEKSEGRKNEYEKEPAPEPEAKTDTPAAGPTEPAAKPEAEAMKQEARELRFLDIASEIDEDRRPTIQTSGDVFIKDAVLLTVSEAGTIPRGSILVRKGRIVAIGPDLETPPDVTVIEAGGMVVMPGIIDTHSHMAILGGVNEASQSVVPEVRVADVVDGDDVAIYRAAAGGVTAARLLHGSANVIGGQDVVIKLRWGRPGRDLILHDERRPTGVKFALGENVVRNRERFPNTRMGVESVLESALLEGRDYAARRAAHEARERNGEAGEPWRRDLRLEALAAIVAGEFKIHCHCYRLDEILTLLRTAERHQIRVQSLQHVLEGYKVAPEIAAHGASASTFSDWWAYKVEAFDAIPYNAALLTEAGAQVCIKSDSDELVRHLNLEAAKMVKYGAVSEAQALKMITLNPARELGLDHRVGSIEVGKDADLAIFNAHPLDSFARCEMTLIEGEVVFQRRGPGALEPRTGDHIRMPQPLPDQLGSKVEIPWSRNGVYALTGGRIHPMSGPEILDGTIVVRDGRIAAIGGPDAVIPPEAIRVDLRGLDVWPGLIDAASQIGLFEIGSLAETRDDSDSALFQPELRASSAIRPDSEVIPVTRANGVLTSFVTPTGGVVSGQGCVIQLDGWVTPQMIVRDPAALSVNIPNFVRPDRERRRSGRESDPNRDRGQQLESIRRVFREARAYLQSREGLAGDESIRARRNPRLEALAPYARGERPVHFRADGAREILDALDLADSLTLKAVIVGGAEAWKVAERLRAADVPVIVTGTLRLPARREEPYDSIYANPLRLHQAGVRFAIRAGGTTDGVTSARNLPFEAAMAVAHGLPEEAALRSITIAPAQILGVDEELGSLEVGKRANLVVTAGPILQVGSAVKAIMIDGRPVDLENRHSRLFAKYRKRLSEIRSGVSPLGLDRDPVNPSGSSGPSEAEAEILDHAPGQVRPAP